MFKSLRARTCDVLPWFRVSCVSISVSVRTYRSLTYKRVGRWHFLVFFYKIKVVSPYSCSFCVLAPFRKKMHCVHLMMVLRQEKIVVKYDSSKNDYFLRPHRPGGWCDKSSVALVSVVVYVPWLLAYTTGTTFAGRSTYCYQKKIVVANASAENETLMYS